ncbi:MAG: hypothetical protein ACXWZM_08525 [Solirubrobacterales bacterium]
MKMLMLQDKSRAERLVDELPELPQSLRMSLLRRKSRRERIASQLESLPPAVQVALVAAATAVMVGAAFLARKKLFVAAAVVADTVEDLGEAASERAQDD